MTRIDTTPIDEAAEALRQARAEIVMLRELLEHLEGEQSRADDLEDELEKVREVNADQAKRLAAYQQDTRQRMARE